MTNILNIPGRLAQLVVAALATIACVATLGLADIQVPGVARIATPTASALVNEGLVIMGPRVERAGGSFYNLRNVDVQASDYQGHPQDWVGAGAHVSGGWTMYGNYAVGWIESCHVYAAGNTLGAMTSTGPTASPRRSKGGRTGPTAERIGIRIRAARN